MVSLNFKSKAPKFDGDKVRGWATVTGLEHEFSSALRRALVVHGFTRLDFGDGEDNTGPARETWSTSPSSSGAPLYLASLLKRRHRVDLKDSAMDAIKCLGPREQSSDEEGGKMLGAAISANSAHTRGGGEELCVYYAGGHWIANCDQSDKARAAFLASAGMRKFEPDNPALREKVGSLPFRVGDPYLADFLREFMSPKAARALKDGIAEARRRYRASSRTRAPEGFCVSKPEDHDFLDFQKFGVAEMGQRRRSGKMAGILLADEMGLGKTVQAIGVLNDFPEARNILIVGQANMKIGWLREVEKWAANRPGPPLSVGYAEGDSFSDTDVVIINNELLSRHVDSLHARKWDLQLIDEAQRTGNDEAISTRVLYGEEAIDDAPATPPVPLADGGQIILMSGTPFTGKVSRLWPLLSRVAPEIFGSGKDARAAFMDRYAPPLPARVQQGRSKRLIFMEGRLQRQEELNIRLRSTCMIRRLKRNVGLPPKWRRLLEMPIILSREEQEVLKEAEANLTAIHSRMADRMYELGIDPSIMEHDRKIATSVIDVAGNIGEFNADFMEIARIRKNLGVLKAPYAAQHMIEELCGAEKNAKIVSFAYHQEVQAIIEGLVEEAFPGRVVNYLGATSQKKRQAAVDRFQDDEGCIFFNASLGAAATGITLTAGWRVRFPEYDWRPDFLVQAEDRAWRIGQEKGVDVGYFAIANTLDARMGRGIMLKMEGMERATGPLDLTARVRAVGPKSGARDPESPSLDRRQPADLFEMA